MVGISSYKNLSNNFIASSRHVKGDGFKVSGFWFLVPGLTLST
jgi:hypothetical protein